MKKKKHKTIEKDYQLAKSKHLERLANKMLKQDQLHTKLKSKPINPDFLNKF